MTHETLGRIHQIVNQFRLVGPQYSFLIRQAHPEKGGAVFTHSFNKTYIREKYDRIKQEAARIGLPLTVLNEGKANEILQIQHQVALTPAQVKRLLTEYERHNNNPAGIKAIIELVRRL